jgi:transcriptional regulator with XRE-family HTH domain
MPVTALAQRAGVDRGSLSAIEAGEANPRPATIGAIERALDDLEHELGMDMDMPPGTRRIGAPEDDLVEIIVEGNFGVRFVVKGPVRDIDEMREAAQKLIASISQGQTEITDNPDET